MPRTPHLMTRCGRWPPARGSHRDNTSEATLRDRAVARDPFVEICGDLPLNHLTRAACDAFFRPRGAAGEL